MEEEFCKFATNLFKTPKDRRAHEAVTKAIRLEELWLSISPDERTDELIALYDRCKHFLISSSQPPPAHTSSTAMEFDLKTAGNLIPDYHGDPKGLKDFLDCARYYNETLKADSQPNFLKFLLNVKLKTKAKTALPSKPTTFKDFESLLKTRFKPRNTLLSVQNELSSLQQRNKSVSEFVTEIEALTTTLSDLQVAEKGETARDVIHSLNDILALNVLKMGANTNIQNVLLAGQAKNFTEGVSMALEAETSRPTHTSTHVNYIRSPSTFGRSRTRGRHNYQQGRRYDQLWEYATSYI